MFSSHLYCISHRVPTSYRTSWHHCSLNATGKILLNNTCFVQSWPDSEAQQLSWNLECFQRRMTGVSGYTRLQQLRSSFTSAVLCITFTAPLPWTAAAAWLPGFSYPLPDIHACHFTCLLLSIPSDPHRTFSKALWKPSTHSRTPASLFSKGNCDISRFTDLITDKYCHSSQDGERKSEYMDAQRS